MTHAVKVGRVNGSFGSLTDAPFDVAAFLAQPLVARISTGRNIVRPTWFLWEDESFWVFIGTWSRLEARLRRSTLFELVVDTCDTTTGLVWQVIARGTGEVVSFDVPRGRRKLIRYLGPDESRWDPRFNLHGDLDARGIRWARLTPDTLRLSDLSFRPADAEPS